MNALVTSNRRESQISLASPRSDQKHNLKAASILTPFLRHLNPGTLAFVMFVSLAVLSPTRGTDLENAGSAPPNPGYLQVFSATDEFDDGGVPYYAHSSYAIYTSDGKLFRNIENRLSRSDEIPEVVALPIGYYTLEARSRSKGYIRVPVAIKAGRRTTLDLDSREEQTSARVLTAKDSGNKIGANR
jgi:hypothetical protein